MLFRPRVFISSRISSKMINARTFLCYARRWRMLPLTQRNYFRRLMMRLLSSAAFYLFTDCRRLFLSIAHLRPRDKMPSFLEMKRYLPISIIILRLRF